MSDLKPCPCCGYPHDDIEAEAMQCILNKIKADAVRDARQDIVNNVVIPKAAKIRQEYYKAAIRHAISNLEAYADKLERGE